MGKILPDGSEWFDPDEPPVAVPVRFSRPANLTEQIRAVIRGELSRQAGNQGHESFEEADDFDVDDDYDPRSPWELNFDQEAERGDRDFRRDEERKGAASEGGGEAKQGVQSGGEEKDGGGKPTPRGE